MDLVDGHNEVQVSRIRKSNCVDGTATRRPGCGGIREKITDQIRELTERGVVSTLRTVLMSDNPANECFMDLKHATCNDVDITTRYVRLNPAAPATRLYQAVNRLCADPDVHTVIVQISLPD